MVLFFIYIYQMKKQFLIVFLVIANGVFAQHFLKPSKKATKWVDSVFKTLNSDEKIAQLFVIRAHSNLGKEHIEEVTNKIKKYNVGGLCFFQGGPIRQAQLTNFYQSITKTPLLVTIDAEWGLGMRLDSVNLLPKNMMLGAMQNNYLIDEVGKHIGLQCKRMGIQLNYAPVADVNNNPANPVINDRSIGEDKNNVTNKTNLILKGMEDVGVMGCFKHFPGHGDVAIDSHLDLPIINKSMQELMQLELYPFKQQIQKQLSCIMTAHLSVPAIDTTKNLPTSLSKKTITDLLKNKLKFKGLIITDGLEMKGVTKYFSSGEVSAQALIAGNDLLCLPENIDSSIAKIKLAVAQKKLAQKNIDASVKKLLLAKYNLGLSKKKLIDTANITRDLNNNTQQLVDKIAENAITIVKQENKKIIPLNNITQPYDKLPNIAHVSIGNGKQNHFSKLLSNHFVTDTYFFNNSFSASFKIRDSIEPRVGEAFEEDSSQYVLVNNIINSCVNQKKYDAIIVSLHQYNRRPTNNFGLDKAAVYLMQKLSESNNAIVIYFGNPYAINNTCNAKNIVACYEDDDIIQQKTIELLQGKFVAKGKLPVTVCNN